MSEIRTIPPKLTRNEWNALLEHSLEKEVSYIIRNNSGTIEAINGSTGKKDYSGTDATTVIQNTVNALGSNGTILIKKGTYTINSYQYAGSTTQDDYGSIIITGNNIKIIGEKGAIIKPVFSSFPSGRLGVILVYTPAKNVEIEGLEIDGSQAGNPSNTTQLMGLYDQWAEKVVFKYNYVHDLNGFQIFVGTNDKPCLVLANIVVGVGTHDVIGGGGGNVTVADNFVVQDTTKGLGTFGAAIDITDVENVIYTNNIAFGNVLFAPEVDNHKSEISNNVIYPAIGLNSTTCEVTNNSSTDCVIEGNIIYKGLIQPRGIGHVVVGNRVINSPTYGINVFSNDSVIANNYVSGSAAEGIRIAASRNLVIGNLVENAGDKGISTYLPENSFIGNTVVNSTYIGILIYQTNNCLVEGNLVKNNNSGNSTTGNGIGLDSSNYCIVVGNMSYDDRTPKLQRFGISASVNNSIIEDNIVTPNANGGINWSGSNNIIRNNVGYVTRNSGVATFSGDGNTTSFTIPHGLVSTPTHVSLEAKSSGAVGDKYWSADGTNITVTFITAPPTGTNNIVIDWKGEI